MGARQVHWLFIFTAWLFRCCKTSTILVDFATLQLQKWYFKKTRITNNYLGRSPAIDKDINMALRRKFKMKTIVLCLCNMKCNMMEWDISFELTKASSSPIHLPAVWITSTNWPSVLEKYFVWWFLNESYESKQIFWVMGPAYKWILLV